MKFSSPIASKQRFARVCLTCLAFLWPQFDVLAQESTSDSSLDNTAENTAVLAEAPQNTEANTHTAVDQVSQNTDAQQTTAETVNTAASKTTNNQETPETVEKLQSVDEETLNAYRSYKAAVERYKQELNHYRIDLRRSLMTDYQNRLSSVDNAYAKKISSLRSEEALMRDNVIERMEAFLKRYGETHEKSADILYRLARLHYERADELYLSDDTGTMTHPDFTITLDYLAKLQNYFPKYEQMDGALYLRGYCQSQMGQSDASRDTFMELVKTYPDSPRRAEVLTRIGEYYFSRSQDAILGLGGEIMWSEALKYYTEAVDVGQDTSVYDRALYRKAWTEYYTEDYDGMLRDFIALVGYADNVADGSALRNEAIDFMAAALAEEDWDLSDDVSIDPDFGMKRFNKYLSSGEPFEAEVLRKFADTLMEQTRYEHAADAYEAYINRGTCAEDLPEVIRVYVAALNYAGKIDKAADEQSRIESRIGLESEWYKCQEREGNLEAIAAANAASQQALKNSIMAYHDRVTKAEDDVRLAEEFLENAKSEEDKMVGQYKLEQAQKKVLQSNIELAEITASFVNRYPNDEENYNYRYLLGQAYFYSEQYDKSIDAFMTIRDIENSRFQADAARYVADAYEYLIDQKAQEDFNYVYALTLPKLIERVNSGQMAIADTPTSILLSGAVTIADKETIDAEMSNRKGGSVSREMPQDVQNLIDAREAFSEIETKMGKAEDEDALAPQYRYDNAMIYYNYGNFEEAEKRFNQIIEKSPASQHAASAAEIIIAEYEMRGDLDKVAELSDMYSTMQLGATGGNDDIVNSRFKDKKYNALFKKAFNLFDNKQYLEAAAEFIRIIDENPTFEHNNRALYNAAYAYEQMKHYDSAMQLYRRVLKEYGETEEAVNALYRIGVNAEKFFDFDTAVDTFMSLYDNKKPLYQNFKYRVNALRNAAKIKLLIEDKKGAAQLLERYHKDFSGQDDAAQFLYEAGRSYAELGKNDEATRIFKEFRKKYASDPSLRAYVIASYVVEADTMRSNKRKLNDAISYYETARALYQNAPTAAGAIGRDNAAKAAYILAEIEYEEWAAQTFKGKMQAMMTQLKEHMAEMKRIYGEFSQVMTYNSPIWGIAARYAIARMMHELVDTLETVPRPSDIKDGSDNHLAFLAAMSEMATGTRDEAIKMYQNAIEASRMAGISMEWTKKSLDGLKQLDRTASEQERLDPMKYIYSSNPLVTPSALKAREAALAEAEAKAEAALAEAEAQAEAEAEDENYEVDDETIEGE